MNAPISASRPRRRGLLVLAVTLTVVLGIRPARTCVLPGFADHTLDPAEQAADKQSPAAPQVSNVGIGRGVGPRSGCGGDVTATSCDDIGSIHLAVSATDDRTTAPEMGYRLSLASGSLPPNMILPTQDIRLSGADGLVLHWIDGATDDQETVNFELRIFSVDRAGNASATGTVVRVRSEGDGGCGIARAPRGEPGGSLLFIAVAAIAWALRRRLADRC